MVLFWSIFISFLVGGVVAFAANKLRLRNAYGEPLRITLPEFGATSLVVVIVAFLVVVMIGPNAARGHAASGYHQFLNGSVTRAWSQDTPCSRDGPCVHTYDCDAYTVTVVDQDAYTDKDGVYHAEQSHQETRYHQCPEATDEFSYFFDTNLGRTVTIADHIYAANPQRWRSGEQLSSGVPRGEPERWVNGKQRLQAGDADPVTVVDDYTNFILPSQDGLTKQYSGSIDKYQGRGLLPAHTENLNSSLLYDYGMRASKVQFLKVKPGNQALWQERLMTFNAALGTERQGDLHIVVVPANQVSDSQDYINALTAYWQNSLGKWGFPKNGIALAIGLASDGKTIKWARAKTGMPIGNGELLAALSFKLPDQPFSVDTVLGQIKALPSDAKDGKPAVRYLHSDGLVDKIMFTDYPFKRACMQCKDKGDNGTSYVYLKDSIPVSSGAKIVMFFIVFCITLTLWALVLFLDPLGAIKDTISSSATDDKFRY